MHNLSSTGSRQVTLGRAFAATDYAVALPDGEVVVRIGERQPAIDAFTGHREWLIVTAFNPDASISDDASNQQADRALRRRIERRGPAVVARTTHRDPAGAWPDERGWLVAPANAGLADELARAFDQRAVVAGSPGQPARLQFTASGPNRGGRT